LSKSANGGGVKYHNGSENNNDLRRITAEKRPIKAKKGLNENAK
jgi:hypothetical protein